MDGHHQHNDQGRDLNSKGVWNQHAWKDTSMKVRHGDGTCLKTSSSSALHTICSNISQVLSPCRSTSLLATQKVKTASCWWPTAWQWKGGPINQTKANWTRPYPSTCQDWSSLDTSNLFMSLGIKSFSQWFEEERNQSSDARSVLLWQQEQWGNHQCR